MKTPLVLVSGLLSNASLWEHQLQHLSQIADITVSSPSQNSLEKMLDAFIKNAPPQFALAGHSMGGWFCLEILRAIPSRVTKVCLLNTTARSDTPEKKKGRREMIERCQNGDFDKITKEIASLFTENPKVRPKVEEMFLKVGPQAFLAQEEAMLNRPPCESVLPAIHCPALVIHAAKDRNFSLEEHLELADQIPNARLAVIEDSGHMSPMEMPQAVTSLLRYWLTY